MAGIGSRGDDRRARATAGAGAVNPVPQEALLVIGALLAVGVVLRFIIAYALLPGSGFPNDLSSFQGWGNDIARNGPIGFYSRTGFIDYPPVYLILLGVVSLFSGGNIGELIKVMPILADGILALVVWRMVLELGASHRRALVAAAIVIINPITWFNSAIWGQADAVGSIFLLLGLRELMADRRETASVLAVVAVLTKMQLGILGFVVGFVVLRRSLLPKSGPREPLRVLTSVGAGLATAAVICMPFTGLDFLGLPGRLATLSGLATVAGGLVAGAGTWALAQRFLPEMEAGRRSLASIAVGIVSVVVVAGMYLDDLVSHLLGTFGEYPYLTLNAYNPWALVGTPDGAAMDRGLSWIRDSAWTDNGQSGTGFLVGPFPGTVVLVAGALAVGLAAAAVLAWRRAGAAAELDPDGETRTAEPGAGRGLLAGHDWPSELRGLAGACAVAAATIAFVFLAPAVAPLPAAIVGDALLVAVLGGVSVWAAWRDDRLSLVVGLTILAIAFFVMPTRVHERYLFPFFILGAILLAVSWRWSLLYLALAVVNAANLVGVLTQYRGIPDNGGQLAGTLMDWGRGVLSARWFNDEIIWPIALSGVVTGLGMAWALLQTRGIAAARLEHETTTAAGPLQAPIASARSERTTRPAAAGSWDAHVARSSVRAASATGPAAASPAGAPAPRAASIAPAAGHEPDLATASELEPGYWEEDEWFEEQAERPSLVPDFVMRIWSRLYRHSDMPDRSRSLDREPRGRLDKLDIWIVVALVIGVLSIRVWRVGEPTDMYFDEVYHARTATEFLQEWEYGIPHDIYEWTHPHFAKYAIGTGIALFSNDKVVSTGQLGHPVVDVLVQPRLATSPLADAGNASDPHNNTDARFGDRIFVTTGSSVMVYDLETRGLEHRYDIPGALSLTTVGQGGIVYVGASDGKIWRIDANSLDDVRLGIAKTPAAPTELAVNTGIDNAHVYAETAPLLVAWDSTGRTVSIDLTSEGGTLLARATIPGLADMVDLGATGTSLILNAPSSPTTTPTTTPTPVTGITDEARIIAAALGLDPEAVQLAIDAATTAQLPKALALGPLTTDQIAAIQRLIDSGSLPDVTVATSDPQVMIAYHDGIGTMDARNLTITSTIPTDEPATSIAINGNTSQDSYVTAGHSLVLVRASTSGDSGSVVKSGDQPLETMPGPVYKVWFDAGTRVAQVLGRTPDGSGWAVYAIETNGDAVFSDAVLPFEPAAVGIDSTPNMPWSNREQLLAFAPDGSMATVNVGQFAFSWRIVGVFFGALMAACLYLLARILFRRRSVGLLVALFTLVDGMFFAQSRIAMNDTYVGGFLLLGYLLFALIWLRVWKGRLAFWLGMPMLGVILGLALSAKWVAAYAIASIGILVLIRSALGRLITILGLAGGTGILGWMAIGEMTTAPNTGNPATMIILILVGVLVVLGGAMWAMSARNMPDRVAIVAGTVVAAAVALGAALAQSPGSIDNGAPNYTYFIIMLVVTTVAAAANASHPIAWSREELWFAIGAPMVLGILAATAGPVLAGALGFGLGASTLLKVGLAGVAAGPAIGVAFWLVGRLGFGPLAVPPAPTDPIVFADPPAPAPEGWLRLGSGKGLPAAWMAICLLVLPLAVYVGSYVPWAMPWQPQTQATGNLPVLWCFSSDATTGTCTNAFPAGHTGQSLWDLTLQMYNYHNNLRASHAASSPWWAWPLDLKPVWFESKGYAGDNGSMIYDGGNPATWWLAIAAMAFLSWQAFKRRSLALALVAIAFFWQWLSWSRIDRASFQYHFYTALPFFLLALAYFLAELWHGPSKRTWLFARAAAAAALLFPAALWLLKSPMCELARVNTKDYFGNTICGNGTGNVVIETRMFLIGLVLLGAFVALGLLLLRLERRQARGEEDPNWVWQLLAPVAAAGALLWFIGIYGPRDTLFQAALPSDMIVWVMLFVLVPLAAIALTARNPRRFVLGEAVFAIAVFIALWPNLSALPMPQAIVGTYNGLLPTWFYGFQFSVNLQQSAHVTIFGVDAAMCGALALVVAGIAGWAAIERRRTIGFLRSGAGESGDGGGAGEASTGEAATGDGSGATHE